MTLAAAGAPAGLLVALAAPQLWGVAAAWVLAVAGLMLADAMLGASPAGLELRAEPPRHMGVGREGGMEVEAVFARGAPAMIELAVGADARLAVAPDRQRVAVSGGIGRAQVALRPQRRGEGRIERLWARWRGPLGLVWLQRETPIERAVPIVPDVEGVKEQALRLFTRDAAFGMKAMMETGEGADFHALKDFQTGMDIGDIDWKQSARHAKLIGREYRTERNHNIVLALDTGRLMCAPVEGLPRIDRAINAALLLAFTALKMGDRVGLFAFDAKLRVASGLVAGSAAFPMLQRLASGVDYSSEETNFTLGLTTLSGRLDRRSLVVVFTDFADSTSAELMIENLGRLMRTHLVLFVAFRDEELETLIAAEPRTADDVTRAVVAGALHTEREVVLSRLRRMGAQIVEAPVGGLGPSLLNTYLDAKRRALV